MSLSFEEGLLTRKLNTAYLQAMHLSSYSSEIDNEFNNICKFNNQYVEWNDSILWSYLS